MKRRKFGIRTITGLAVAMAMAAVVVAAAVADVSPGPVSQDSTTLYWSGQGTPVNQQCNHPDPGAGGYQNGATGSNYMLWIFSTDGGSVTGTPTLTVNGTTYGNAYFTGGVWQIVTPYVDPGNPADKNDDSSTGDTYASFVVNTTGNGAWILTISHGCGGNSQLFDDLSVTKSANTSYTRTYNWTIDKSSDTAKVYSAGGGTSGAVNYTVAVTKTGYTDSGWTVHGDITVSNPNASQAATVTDVTDSLAGANVLCQDGGTDVTFPHTLAGGGQLLCSYSASVADATNGTNTATATWVDFGSPNTSGTGIAGYTFGDPTSIVNDEIDVSDSNPDSGAPWHFTDSGSQQYSETFTDPAGTCTSHKNVAEITQTGQQDDVTVQDCQGANLTVSKTANPAFKRAYKWSITKAVDKTTTNIISGTAIFNYTVNVSHDAGTDSGWTVSGKITVSNPNDWEDITANVSDALPGGTCTVTGGTSVVIPKSDSKTLDYSCTFTSNPGTGTNVGTATWDGTAAHTTNSSATGSKGFAFGDPTDVTDECVNVSDTFNGTPGSLGSACVVGDPNPKSFQYPRTIPAPPLGTCVIYPNTAKFTTTDTGATGSASKSVSVCAKYTAYTPGYWKNHLANPTSGGPGYSAVCKTLKYGSCSTQGIWTIQYLPQTLGNFTVAAGDISTAGQIFTLMNCSSTKDQDAVGCLAGHLLAAKLNIASGSPAVQCITDAIASANALLVAVGYNGPTGSYTFASATQRNQAIALKSTFDNYNNQKGC